MRQINSDSSADFSQELSNDNALPSIFAFPKDGNFWRIDWFGDISFPNRLLRRKQPSVLVHLSRVLDTSFHENPAVLLSPDSTLASRQRKVWISVGTLPLLRIGDIWKNGQLTTCPDYEIEHFPDLDINPETAVLIKAGLNLDEKGFLLPLTEHPWHRQCTHSYCLMVDLPNNRRLIIPCMELIRFYFGSSSNLLTKLFLPPLSRDALYSKPHFHKITGHLSLQLAAGISGASASDIGRLHLEPVAWRTAVHVGTSLLRGSVANQGAYPQAFFPFEGKTDLIVSGKWLSLGDESRASFLAYSLRSCSHPFPFKRLQYDIRDRNTARKPSSNETSERQRRTRKFANDSPDQGVVENDPSSKLANQAKHMWNAERFPDLMKKPIWKNRVLVEPVDKAMPIASPSQAIGHAAIGEPGTERRIRPIDLQIKFTQKSAFPIPDFLREIVEELNTLEDYKVELLTESAQDGWTIPIPTPANDDGEIDMRLFVKVGKTPLRERRIAVFSIARRLERVSIVVIESTPVHINFYLPPLDDKNTLCEALRRATVDFIARREFKTESVTFLAKMAFNAC